jgi:hypothetical protein
VLPCDGTHWQTFSQQHLARAFCLMSRRDGAIVAWHEVPGKASPQKSRPVGYGLIYAGVRTDSMIVEIWFSKIECDMIGSLRANLAGLPPSAVLLPHATSSVFHQRDIGRVL